MPCDVTQRVYILLHLFHSMLITQFAVNYLARRSATSLLVSPKDFNESSPAVKKLYVTSVHTAAVAVVDEDGHVRMGAAPEFVEEDGTFTHALYNVSDTHLMTARSETPYSKQFVSIAERERVTASAIKGTMDLPTTAIGGDMTGRHLRFFFHPKHFLIGYGKEWIEGNCKDQEVQDLFEQHYGAAAKEWIVAVAHAMDNQVAIANIYARVKANGTELQTLVGNDVLFEKLDIDLAPTVALRMATPTIYPEDYLSRQQSMGPYVQPPAAAAAIDRAPPALTAVALAEAFTSKEEKKSKREMKDGELSNHGVYMAGEINVKTGVITNLAFATPTAAYQKACALPSKEEKTRELGRMLNSNNVDRPANSIRATQRNMKKHDDNLVSNLASGNWSTQATTVINGKSNQVTVAAFIPLLDEVVETLLQENNAASFEAATSQASKAGDKRTWIATSAVELDHHVMKSMLANIESASQTMYVTDDPDKKSFAILYAQVLCDLLIETETEEWLRKHNTPQEKKQFCIFLLARFDKFLSGLAAAGQNYVNHAAIVEADIDKVKVKPYEEATMNMAEDITEIRKMIRRNQPCKEVSDLTIMPTKKPRPVALMQPDAVDDVALVPAPARPAGGRRNEEQAAPFAWGGNQHGSAAKQDSWNKKSNVEVARSKKRGDMIAAPNFNRVLHPRLAEKYCAPFSTMGRACDPEKCKPGIKHLSVYRFSEEERQLQIAHVEANPGNLFFNYKSCRFLPENKKHLMADEKGNPVGEKR